ncbi:general substrate transporter, partial [Syncephalis pseudoplumigaleata]
MSSRFYIAVSASALCGIYIGYDLGVISGILTMPASIEHFRWRNDTEKGFVVSSFVLGAFFSSMFSGLLADRFGRRNTIIGASVVFVLGGILQTAATGLVMLYIGRIIAGLTVGITYAVVPLYHSEISPRKQRGAIVFLKNLGINTGMLLAYAINYATSHLKGKASFRVTLAFQIIPAFLVVLG